MKHIMAAEPAPTIHENAEAEAALLGCLLENSKRLMDVGGLAERHFSSELNRRIFSEVVLAFENNKILDIITLNKKANGWVDGGQNHIMQCVAAKLAVVNLSDYADVIIQTYERRELARACHEAIAMLDDYDQQPKDISEFLSAQITDSAPKNGFVTEQELNKRLLDRLGKSFNVYSTGLDRLDEAMGGGIHQGMMYGMVGRKKAGKTMFACTISEALMMGGVKHLFLALEMGSERIHQRAAARALGINEAAFQKSYGKTEDCQSRVAALASTPNDVRLWSDAPRIGIDALRREVVTAKLQNNITGFIVDGWQLVTGRDSKQTQASHLDHVAQVLAELCMKYKLWCVVTAQANQDGNTREGEGLRMACDQVFQVMKPDDDTSYRWVEMMDSRYTQYMDIGSEDKPAFEIINGTHVEEVGQW